MRDIAIYIHIPFCKSKCHYCDFYSLSGQEDKIPQYIKALNKEIAYYANLYQNINVKSVFFGGGTPSILEPSYILSILNELRKGFKFTKDIEISLESNPGTLSYDKLKAYHEMGINRLSIGLQAWQDNMLKSMGRIHTQKDFVDNLYDAKKAGFYNINVDLIHGLPTQTLKDWTFTLKNIVELEILHISCYSLKLEEGTPWGDEYYNKSMCLPEEEEERDMYHYSLSYLKGKGYKHYEISNFSKPGYHCRHNLVYWKCEEYIGVGSGSHGYIDGIRYENVPDLEKYIDLVLNNVKPRIDIQKIDLNEAVKEHMIMGLRLIDGVSIKSFETKFKISPYDIYKTEIEKMVVKGLIEIKDNMIRLTKRGLDFANQVFVEFI